MIQAIIQEAIEVTKVAIIIVTEGIGPSQKQKTSAFCAKCKWASF